MQRHAAEVLLREGFGYKDRETFVVVAEPECASLAEALAAGARDRGFPAALLVVPRRATPESEPPDYVVETLRAADIALLLSPHTFSRTKALKAALQTGLRAAEIVDPSPDLLDRLASTPFAALSSAAIALSGALEPGGRIRVKGTGGSDFEFVASADREIRDGVVLEKGRLETLPPGFVRIAIDSGTFTGEVRADMWPPATDGSSGRLVLRFEKGKVVYVSRPGLGDALSLEAESVGFGLNPASHAGRSAAESIIAAGTAFVRLVNPMHPGTVSIDVAIAEPQVEVGGVPVPTSALAPASRPVLPALKSAGDVASFATTGELAPEIFRLFFENSNDPQYALDLETQRFILANDAFLRLTGYSRSDVAAGRLHAPDLAAEESRDKVREKITHRKSVPSERYEMRIRCADGTKKQVELSVQRIRFQEREVVIGSIRDTSTQDKMKRDLTERATDAIRKTLEIYALTEKIKNVPKLTPALLSGRDEDEILARAHRILLQKPGLSYASATIYLIQEHALVQRYPAPDADSGPARFDLSKNHRLAKIARGEESETDSSNERVALALNGRDGILGVLEVAFDQKEAAVMAAVKDGHTLRSEYRNILVSIAQILGLSIENLRLYNVVKEQSEIDQLTGVWNRRVFDKRLGDEMKRARRYGRDLALLMIDLDHFKQVNDTYGHQKGDETLKDVASFLRIQSRNVDVVSRYGGDEFCLLLPECNVENALLKAEVLRKRFVTRKFSTVGKGGKIVRLTLSIGVGGLSDATGSEHELLKLADSALYHAKGLGRNRVCGPDGCPAK